MTDLSNLMGMSFGDIPDQKLLEDGIYEFTVAGYYDREYEKDGEKRTIVVVRSTADAVIEADFAEEDLANAEVVRKDFFGTPKAMQNKSPTISLKAFTATVLDMSTDEINEMDIPTALEMMIGRRYKGIVKRGMEGRNKDIPVAQVVKVLGAV